MSNHLTSSDNSADSLEEQVPQAPSLRVYTGEAALRGGHEFRALFQRRHEYARMLLELSTRQQQLIETAEFSSLIELLLRKQTVLDELQAISQTDPPLLEQWKDKRDSISQTERQECDHWLSLSEQVLSELMDLEQRCTSQLQHKRDTTQTQLEAVSGTIHLQDAYSQPPVSHQFDRSQ